MQSSALAVRSGWALRPAGSPSRCSRGVRRQGIVAGALEPSAVVSVSQMAIAYAAFVGAEAVFTGLNSPGGTPGRPGVLQTLGGCGAAVAATAALQQEGLGALACGAGLAASVAMLAYYGLRTKDTPYDPREWPGAKAWPASMVLVSFFMLAAFQQGLAAAL